MNKSKLKYNGTPDTLIVIKDNSKSPDETISVKITSLIKKTPHFIRTFLSDERVSFLMGLYCNNKSKGIDLRYVGYPTMIMHILYIL